MGQNQFQEVTRNKINLKLYNGKDATIKIFNKTNLNISLKSLMRKIINSRERLHQNINPIKVALKGQICKRILCDKDSQGELEGQDPLTYPINRAFVL